MFTEKEHENFKTIGINELTNVFNTKQYVQDKYNVAVYNNQIEIFESVISPLERHIVIGQARGAGKSYGVALSLIELCRTTPKLIIAIFAPKGPQSKRLLNEMYQIISSSTTLIKDAINWEKSSSMVMEFMNGAKVQALSGNDKTMSEGEHPNCMDSKILINTNKGQMLIGDIVENKKNILIKSYNEHTKQIEYKPITHWHKNKLNKRKMLKIQFEANGRIETLVCTEDHEICTKNRGWVKAKDLNLERDIITVARSIATINRNKRTTHEEYLKRGGKSKQTQIKKHINGELTPWNKGLTKETDNRVKQVSNSLMGHLVSAKTITLCKEWGEKWGKINGGKFAKIKPRLTEGIICNNCGETFYINGTETTLKRLRTTKKLCSYCTKKIAAKKIAKVRQQNGSYNNIQCNFKHFEKGYQMDLGHYTRSSWEKNYCRVLKLLKIPYQYESKVFILIYSNGDTHRFTPDIQLSKTEWVEIKGQFFENDKIKLQLFREQYPTLHITVVGDKKRYPSLVDVDYKTYIKPYLQHIDGEVHNE
jgi:hypothetical protein